MTLMNLEKGWQVLKLRKNGDNPTYPVKISIPDVCGGATAASIGIDNMAIVACDSGQIIEYSIDVESASTGEAQIVVVGYWE